MLRAAKVSDAKRWGKEARGPAMLEDFLRFGAVSFTHPVNVFYLAGGWGKIPKAEVG